MKIDRMLTTAEILAELGSRLRGYRLQQNLSVDELAIKAGLGERTIRRIEGGEGASMENIVKLLRALDRIDALESFLPAPLISPMVLAEREGKYRKRASSPRPPIDNKE